MDAETRRVIDGALFSIPIQYQKFKDNPPVADEVRRFCGMLSVLIENGVELPTEGREYLATALRSISAGVAPGKALFLAGKAKDFAGRDEEIASYIHDRKKSGEALNSIFSDIAINGVPNVEDSALSTRLLSNIWKNYGWSFDYNGKK